ncbi:MAG TPA: beta-N-acetylhexosaminidase [Candidatus Competibacteraceae bacterium]|nr:beta-N-acetylhexosaminidase [Candidatus Competibacteraceae bacterium]MCP5134270.1 beta-N-acetylhexosaminidase [Gammaproteobacteria bacterium]HPF59231.1 beta-N-acetylhexosaminidase [Candidatus Competibacteraceae bacterium]HRY18645.1 beta-N-acetylhexosaminidase [Candidatus Competibacteraceae bacterium]
MALGPVMLGLESLMLTAEERELLKHPLVGGVILFARNYQSPEQIARLTEAIHALRQPRLLIAVDHEGGRVQRFREGFTRLPAVRRLGEIYDQNPLRAKQLARITGWLMATELRAVGVDFSFAPVLDLDHGVSGIIGDRAFHHDPEIVADLAHAYASGMQKAGMEAVGKHFPGHGGIAADSHLELPVDPRSYVDLATTDLLAFERMIHYGLAALMPAHVLYPQVDDRPAGFSTRWLKSILRQELEFHGVVFSDDLDMAGAQEAGDPPERARAALMAGCDMVLACNDRRAAVAILDQLGQKPDPVSQVRLIRLHGRGRPNWKRLHHNPVWQRTVRLVQDYDASPLLEMDI